MLRRVGYLLMFVCLALVGLPSLGAAANATGPAASTGTAADSLQVRVAAMRGDKDCSDFSTQKAAQDFFIANGGPQSDPHRLDADGDGVVCESNPCPCSTSTGGNGGGDGGPKKKAIRRESAKIIKVIDGDTVRVRLASGGKKDVRLLGIDTPEVYGGVECGGPQASRSLKKLLPRGTRVKLISDRTQPYTDRYNRLLRYVMKNGTDASKYQLRKGMAAVYTVGKRVTRYPVYKRTQVKAMRNNVGSWKTCR